MNIQELTDKINEVFVNFTPTFDIDESIVIKKLVCPFCGKNLQIITDHDDMNDLGCVSITCSDKDPNHVDLSDYQSEDNNDERDYFCTYYRTYSIDSDGRGKRDIKKEFKDYIEL